MKLNISRFAIFLPFAYAILSGCVKTETLNPPDNSTVEQPVYDLKLETGGNQTDTIGHRLPEQIFFSATKDSSPYFTGYLDIRTVDCDGKVQTETHFLKRIDSVSPDFVWLLNITWKLNATVGTQSLTAVLMDSLKVPQDSVTVNANAVAPGNGWNPSGCLGDNSFPVTFCELSSGRLLTGLYLAAPLYYSDDKGISWHELNTFPRNRVIRKLLTTSKGEIILATKDDGVFFSSDGGASWQSRNQGLTLTEFAGAIYYTKNETLFASTGSAVFVSHDNALTWQTVQNGLPYYASFYSAASLSDGTIVAISAGQLIYSTDGGLNWGPVYTVSAAAAFHTVFADENDNVYAAGGGAGMDYGLYVSKDNMQTWERVYDEEPPVNFQREISHPFYRNGVFYFYSSTKNILKSTTDFINYKTIPNPSPDINGEFTSEYFVTTDDYLIASTQYFGLYYRFPDR